MAMLPNDYHPGPRCSCEGCLGEYPDDPEDTEPPEPDGECYRGSEYASALAESQAWIQRNLK